MTITDEDLAQHMHAVLGGVAWGRISSNWQADYLALARTARRLLCPRSEDDLRMERGKAAQDAWENAMESGDTSDDRWSLAAAAAIAKKAEQDREAP